MNIKKSKSIKSSYYYSDEDYDRIDRSGSQRDVEIAAITYYYGISKEDAMKERETIDPNTLEDAVDYYFKRDLPRSERIKSSITSARKPKYWNTMFKTKVIDAYESGELTWDNIREWETAYNDGVIPHPSLGTREILQYYLETKDKEVNSAYLPDYGGAFDIDPHSYWTKDDIVEFAYALEDAVNEQLPGRGLQFYDTYIVDYKRLVVDFVDADDNEFSCQCKLDLRKAKTVNALIRVYVPLMSEMLIEDVQQFDFEMGAEADWGGVESAINLDSYGDGYVEMRDGEPNFVYQNLADAKRGMMYSRIGDSQNNLGEHEYKLMRWKDHELQEIEECSSGSINAAVDSELLEDPIEDDIYMEISQRFAIRADGEFELPEEYLNDWKNYWSEDFEDPETGLVVCTSEELGDWIDSVLFESPIFAQLPYKPGDYRFEGEVVIPYTITNVYVNSEKEWEYDGYSVSHEYDTDDADVDIKWDKATVVPSSLNVVDLSEEG